MCPCTDIISCLCTFVYVSSWLRCSLPQPRTPVVGLVIKSVLILQGKRQRNVPGLCSAGFVTSCTPTSAISHRQRPGASLWPDRYVIPEAEARSHYICSNLLASFKIPQSALVVS
jgi:hypothetical protein